MFAKNRGNSCPEKNAAIFWLQSVGDIYMAKTAAKIFLFVCDIFFQYYWCNASAQFKVISLVFAENVIYSQWNKNDCS